MHKRIKRGIDILLSLTGLLIAGPFMAVIALLIWIDSPGPILFAQERLGLHGTRFRILKFRKFPPNWKNEGPGVTTRKDPRMTTVGAVLERTKLDELPQLWNILKGEMTFVGPRPESLRFADLFTGEYAQILDYVPGIFGPNQVLCRNECECYIAEEDPDIYYREVLFPAKAQRDLHYFKSAGLWNDMYLMVEGVLVTIFGTVNWTNIFQKDLKIWALDYFLVVAAWISVCLVRFAGLPNSANLLVMLSGLKIIPPLMLAGLIIGGCYKCPFKFFSIQNTFKLAKVVLITWLLIFILMLYQFRNISLLLLPMMWLSLLMLLMVPRSLARLHWEKALAQRSGFKSKETLLYGAGRTGVILAGCFGKKKFTGFVDDNPSFSGLEIRGLQVFGMESDIATIYKVHPFSEIWMTFRPSEAKRVRMEELCGKLGISLLVLSDYEPFTTLEVISHATMGFEADATGTSAPTPRTP